MAGQTRFALIILLAAFGMGIIGNALVPNATPGFGLSLWLVLVSGVGLVLARIGKVPLGPGIWLVIPGFVFAAMFSWRDAEELRYANGFAFLIASGLVILSARRAAVRPSWTESSTGFVLCSLLAPVDAISLVYKDIEWKSMSGERSSRSAAVIGRTLLLLVPLLLVFGGLFMSADKIFSDRISGLFNWDLSNLGENLVWIGLLSAIPAGVLRRVLIVSEQPTMSATLCDAFGVNQAPPVQTVKKPFFGETEVAVALGALNLLFAAFIAVQVRYLFGGANHVQLSAGLTYADYARSGFFELVWVSVLVLPVLLAARSFKSSVAVSVCSLGLIASVSLVIVSALQRMRIYVDAYGLTAMRLYPSALMVWLALVFLWIGFQVFRKQDARNSLVPVLLGFAVILGLNFMNPDATMARVNLARGAGHVDVKHLEELSADAVPVLLSESAGRSYRPELVSHLRDAYGKHQVLHGENLARLAAREAVAQNNHVTTGR